MPAIRSYSTGVITNLNHVSSVVIVNVTNNGSSLSTVNFIVFKNTGFDKVKVGQGGFGTPSGASQSLRFPIGIADTWEVSIESDSQKAVITVFGFNNETKANVASQRILQSELSLIGSRNGVLRKLPIQRTVQKLNLRRR